MISKSELFSRLEWDVNENGCWNITSHKKPNNRDYPTISINRKAWGVSRAVYSAVYGGLHSRDIVRHKCDNPMCMNPDHLIAGTKKDNTQDMLERGRESRWSNGKGRNGHRQVLSIEEIVQIKESPLSSYKLAEIYPVSSVQIRRIRNGSRCADIQS